MGSVADRSEIPDDRSKERSAKWSYLSRANRVRLNTTTKWTRPLFCEGPEGRLMNPYPMAALGVAGIVLASVHWVARLRTLLALVGSVAWLGVALALRATSVPIGGDLTPSVQ